MQRNLTVKFGYADFVAIRDTWKYGRLQVSPLLERQEDGVKHREVIVGIVAFRNGQGSPVE